MKILRSVLLIGLTMLMAWPVLALSQPSIFDAMYWVKGNVTVDITQQAQYPISKDLSARRVVFYQGLPGGYVENVALVNLGGDAKTGPGRYMLNIYDNAMLKIDLDPAATYYAAIAQDPDDKYGADPVAVKITRTGFESADLNLSWGKGPILPLPGAVTLFVSRDGKNIKLSWDKTAYPDKPEIYMLAEADLNAPVSGIFTNVPDTWNLITGDLQPSDDGFYWHVNQVGGGRGEVYYKGLQKGLTDIKGTFARNAVSEILKSAWAVGKVDVPLFKGAGLKFTRISFPLLQTSREWKDIIGDQLQSSDTASQADQILQWNGTGWNTLYLTSQGNWALLNGTPFKYTLGEGYSVRIPGRANQKPSLITIVGDVKVDSFKIADSFRNLAQDKYTIFAQPFPKGLSLDDAGFKNTGAFASATQSDADQILKWNGTGWISMYLSAQGWKQLGADSFTFIPAIGYSYRKGDKNATSPGYNWTLSPNY